MVLRGLNDVHLAVCGGARDRSAGSSSRSPKAWSSAASMSSHQAVLRWEANVKEDLSVSESHRLLPAPQDDRQEGEVGGRDSKAVQ